jgi:hypothetical protein
MKVGDLIQINKQSSAGGLWGKAGIIKSFEHRSWADYEMVTIFLQDGRLMLIDARHVDVL